MKIAILKYGSLSVLISVVIALTASISWAADSNSTSPLTSPSDPERTSTIDKRIAQRKSTVKAQLSATQQKGIAERCVAAKAKLRILKARIENSASNRRKVYTELATNLNKNVSRLKNKNIDTTALKAAQEKFNRAINQYLSDALVYKTDINDLINMDCAADPQGFEATLLSARQQRAQLASDAKTIRDSSPDLIKAINDAKKALANAEAGN